MGRFASLLLFLLCFIAPSARAGLFTGQLCGEFIANPDLESGLREALARHGVQHTETDIQLWLPREKAAYWLIHVAEQRKTNFHLLASLRVAIGRARELLESSASSPRAKPSSVSQAQFEQQLDTVLRQFVISGCYPSDSGMTLLVQLASLDAQMAEGRQLAFRALRAAMERELTVALDQTPEPIKAKAAEAAQGRFKQAITADMASPKPLRFESAAITLNANNLRYYAPDQRTNILRNLRGAVAELKSSSPPFLIEEAELEIEYLESYGVCNLPLLEDFLKKLGQLRSEFIRVSTAP